MSTHIMKAEFQPNVGCIDSMIRIFIGQILLCGALAGVWNFWGLAGGILVINGLSRYSFIYHLFGINTFRCDNVKD